MADLLKKRSTALFRALIVTKGMRRTLDREEERLRILKWVNDPISQNPSQHAETTSENGLPKP